MENINVVITGDRAVQEKFDRFPQAAHKRLHDVIESFTERLVGRVRAAAPKRTGKLESEIRELISDKPERIVGLVYIRGQDRNDYAKAGALEYGAHGQAKVSAHEMRLDHVFSHALAGPLMVSVAAYSRQMNIAEHRFMRGSIDAMKGEITRALKEAVGETVDEANK